VGEEVAKDLGVELTANKHARDADEEGDKLLLDKFSPIIALEYGSR